MIVFIHQKESELFSFYALGFWIEFEKKITKKEMGYFKNNPYIYHAT